jgi:hypothetical protein
MPEPSDGKNDQKGWFVDLEEATPRLILSIPWRYLLGSHFEMTSETFSVNPFDPSDVRSKLPEMRRQLAAERQELEALGERVRGLSDLIEHLALVAGSSAHPTSATGNGDTSHATAPGQARAVAALERADKPMKPAALFEFMRTEKMPAPKTSAALNASLWAAAKAGRVKRLGQGMYAPLSWEADADYKLALSNGSGGESLSGAPNSGSGE